MRRTLKVLREYVCVAGAAYWTMNSFHSAIWYSLPNEDGHGIRGGSMTSIQLNLMSAAVGFAILVWTILNVARMPQVRCDLRGDDSTIG